MTNSGWKLKLVTPPVVEPVTLEEAKEQCRVVISADDAFLTGCIIAAREAAELYTRRAFVAQTWEAGFERFPECFELAKPPLIRVVEITYTDDDGVAQTLAADQYTVDDYSQPARVLRPRSVTWPVLTETGIRVRVRFEAGYERGEGSPANDAANVPEGIRQAIKLHVGEMYENRDVAHAMPQACESLLHPYRVYGWGDA